MKSRLIKIWSWIHRYQVPIIGIVIFTTWISAPWWVSFFPGIGSVERKGQFGDSFGGLNALFSGFAFLGVIYAILLQREQIQLQSKELKAQRKELKLQRKELHNSVNELTRQGNVMQKESFERTFFHLLEMLEKKYNLTEYHENIQYTDLEHYRRIEQDYAAQGKKVVNMGKRIAMVAHKGEDAFAWALLSEDWSSVPFGFDFYFSLFYFVLQFIDQANWGNEDKEKELYAGILRNRMSEEELILLFNYACPYHYLLQSEGHIDELYLKRLIEKYAIFSILYSNQFKIGNKKNWKQKVTSYDISAFGPNPDDEIKAAFQEKDKKSQ